MMDRSVQELERAGGRMAGDLRSMIADSEDLLNAAATVSGEGFAVARTRFEEKVKRAKAALAEASQPVFDRTRETVAVADHYVHDNVWTVVGIAIATGALIGLLAARR